MQAVSDEAAHPLPSGVVELDRVLAGGLLPGSVTLLGGEPGIGKSTLVMQVAAASAAAGRKALVIAAEESEAQVCRRARRLGALPEGCFVLSTTDVAVALEAAANLSPELLVVDSIQMVSDTSVTSPAGSPNQVRECAQRLARYGKESATSVVLVGHVTKDGSLAGPRTLEHLVDTVLSFDGDRHHALRTLVATKHRFGPAGEVGLLEMGESGLASVEDPSRLLLADRRPDAPGSVAVPVVEGRRPLLVEVQALLADSRTPTPRRVVQGVSASRVALVLAVLERLLETPIGASDVFVSTVGGVRVVEPAADLAIALALVSAFTGVPVPEEAVSFGEIGLAGEIRQVQRPERRLAEAGRLGFRRAIGPGNLPEQMEMQVERVSTVGEALAAAGLWFAIAGGARRRAPGEGSLGRLDDRTVLVG